MKKLIVFLFMVCLVITRALRGMDAQNIKGNAVEDLDEKARKEHELRCLQEEEYRRAEEEELKKGEQYKPVLRRHKAIIPRPDLGVCRSPTFLSLA